MMGIQLLEDSSLDKVSQTEEGDFFSGAGSFREGEKYGWKKDFDLVQGKWGYLFSILRLARRRLEAELDRIRIPAPKNKPFGAVEESAGGNLSQIQDQPDFFLG